MEAAAEEPAVVHTVKTERAVRTVAAAFASVRLRTVRAEAQAAARTIRSAAVPTIVKAVLIAPLAVVDCCRQRLIEFMPAAALAALICSPAALVAVIWERVPDEAARRINTVLAPAVPTSEVER